MTLTVRVPPQYKCASPLKAAYRDFFFLFFCRVLKRSYLITGAVFVPRKLAVIFHLQAQEGKQCDGVIHLRGQRKTSPLVFIGTGLMSFCWRLQGLACLLTEYLSVRHGFWQKKKTKHFLTLRNIKPFVYLVAYYKLSIDDTNQPQIYSLY